MSNENIETVITLNNTSELTRDIATLCLNQKFSDVTLIVGEEKLPAHKAILSVRSRYFESLWSASENDGNFHEVIFTNVSNAAFAILLEYIYSGKLALSSDSALTLSVLGLAHRYSVKDLLSGITSQLQLNLENACATLNAATLHDLEDLRDACHSFMDANAPEILLTGRLNDLNQESMIGLLKRDTFAAPEIDIFRSVAKWCDKNTDVDNLVIQCVRLSLLNVADIVSVVWPSKLIQSDHLFQAIAEIVEIIPQKSHPRVLLQVDEDLAIEQHQAIAGQSTSGLLMRVRNFASRAVDGTSSFIVKLHTPSYLNHIQMMLDDHESMHHYSYCIEVSVDQKTWKRVVDYSQFACRSLQNLYFEQQAAQYIKIVGTGSFYYNTTNTSKPLNLLHLEVYLKSSIPKLVNGILYPDANVATPEKGATVIAGENRQYLLNGDTHTGCTYHEIDRSYSSHIIVQLAQPFMISSMKLLLWDKDDRNYLYFIETSVNKKDWEMAVDRRNVLCRSWQNLTFEERAVVFIRITGTHNTAEANRRFHCTHFECPAQEEDPQ